MRQSVCQEKKIRVKQRLFFTLLGGFFGARWTEGLGSEHTQPPYWDARFGVCFIHMQPTRSERGDHFQVLGYFSGPVHQSAVKLHTHTTPLSTCMFWCMGWSCAPHSCVDYFQFIRDFSGPVRLRAWNLCTHERMRRPFWCMDWSPFVSGLLG